MKTKQSKTTQLSQTSFDNLQAELHELEEVKLPAVVERIARAREQGDLSENSEYKDAKDQQELLEVRIGEINKILEHAEVVDEDEINDNVIRVGSLVTLKVDGGKETTYKVIAEYDKTAGAGDTISAVSPIGKAILGQGEGACVNVETPGGERAYTICKFVNDN
ncbi:transcription elongation factor GreA [bacterium]|nr:transcription elongation factor GreA [bacterium]